MVYKNGFIVVVESYGKILRESRIDGEQVVALPFMSDYSLLLKNKESRRAQVKVEIDGKDVLGGTFLVVAANSETRLEGFLDGNIVRNKFRFIQKTQGVIEHRGDRADDGIIRIEFCYEQPKEEHIHHIHHEYHYHPIYWSTWQPLVTWSNTSTVRDSLLTNSTMVDQINIGHQELIGDQISCSFAANAQTIESDIGVDEGITVPGAYVHQEFDRASIGPLESNSSVVIIRLRGTTQSGTIVVQPVTTREKLICNSCGKKWSSDHKFCGSCGTALI